MREESSSKWVIISMGLYYSCAKARKVGSINGLWAQDNKEALGFATEKDAEDFKSVFLKTNHLAKVQRVT